LPGAVIRAPPVHSIFIPAILVLGEKDASRLLPQEEIGMSTLNVVLSEHHEVLIADLVESGQFHNANDVLQEGLRLVEANHQQDARKEQKMHRRFKPDWTIWTRAGL
jgi:putative addiction module CopG family antidote